MSLATEDFDYVRDIVRQRSAIVLEPGKEYLVEARLNKLVTAAGVQSIAGLVARMRTEPAGGLADQVVDAMTTNETSFFRDVMPFDAVQRVVLPELLQARAQERKLTMWSAASSSGQEAYSLAILAKDALQLHPGWDVEVLATDLSEEMLERTRAGVYSAMEVNRGLPVSMLVRHFDRVGTAWRVSPDLRAMVQTRAINLAAPFPALPRFDVVFLRNVLIYFDVDAKRAVLERVRRVLRPDGYLFLGGAETTLGLDDAFERVVIDRATAYRLRG